MVNTLSTKTHSFKEIDEFSFENADVKSVCYCQQRMKRKLSLSSECVKTKLCKPCTSFTSHLHSSCGMVWYRTLRVNVSLLFFALCQLRRFPLSPFHFHHAPVCAVNSSSSAAVAQNFTSTTFFLFAALFSYRPLMYFVLRLRSSPALLCIYLDKVKHDSDP